MIVHATASDEMSNRRPTPMFRGTSGFTLVELMIVVAVVAILAAVALPSYNESVRKSRRSEAKAILVELAQLAERHHTVHNAYTGFSVDDHEALKNQAKQYQIANTIGAQSFSLSATPVADSDQANDRCGALGLNQTGQKTASKGKVADCW